MNHDAKRGIAGSESNPSFDDRFGDEGDRKVIAGRRRDVCSPVGIVQETRFAGIEPVRIPVFCVGPWPSCMTTAENHSTHSRPGFWSGKRDFEATFSVRQDPGAIVGSNDQRTRNRRLGDGVDHGPAHSFALRFARWCRLAETLRRDYKHGDEAEWQTPEKDWLGDPKEHHFGP